jgi:photosystem II stability/assembly factor-like uncharacterized protein
MKTLLLISVLLVLSAGFAQAGWFWQNPKPQGNMLNSVYFVDQATGYAVGNAGTIIKTTDGGISWIRQTSGTIWTL